jgi:hypothetical protein
MGFHTGKKAKKQESTMALTTKLAPKFIGNI